MNDTYISFKKYPDAAQAKDVEQLLLIIVLVLAGTYRIFANG